MYKPSALLSARNPGCLFFKLWRRYRSNQPVVILQLCQVLIVDKMTRLDFERRLFKELSDAEFEKMLKQRSTNTDKLRYSQDHKKSFQVPGARFKSVPKPWNCGGSGQQINCDRRQNRFT